MRLTTQLAPLPATLLVMLLAKLLGRLLVLRLARRGDGVALAMVGQLWGCMWTLLTGTAVTSWMRLRGRTATRACTRLHCNGCSGTVAVMPSVLLGLAAW